MSLRDAWDDFCEWLGIDVEDVEDDELPPDPSDPNDIRNYDCEMDDEGFLLGSDGDRLFDDPEFD